MTPEPDTGRHAKIALAIVSLLIVVLCWSGSTDAKSKATVDSAFKQALIVFGTAKALNGVISMAQGTEVGPPGVTIAVGELLDPVNDLVEQFSWVMLASMTSLGIQSIVLGLTSTPAFDLLLTLTLIGANLWFFLRPQTEGKSRALLLRFTLLLLFLRLSIPLMALANHLLYEGFLSREYNIEQLDGNITLLSQELEILQTDTAKSSGSFFGSVEKYFDKSYYDALMERYKNSADQASEQIVKLIIVFVFQTLLFPLLFLFALYRMVRVLFEKV